MLKLLCIFVIVAMVNAQLHRIPLQKKPNYMKSLGNVRAERLNIMAKHQVELEEETTECIEELDNRINNLFSGQITIGTPPQTFNAVFDTGSIVLYVQRQCDTDANDSLSQIICSDTEGYNATASSTAYSSALYSSLYPDSVENVTFETTAELMQDVVGVAGMKLQSVSFSAGEFKIEGSEVLFGMSVFHKYADPSQYYPTIYYMKQQGYINDLMFSLYMPPVNSGADGQVIFGGSDSNLYNGSLSYVHVHDRFNWSIIVENVAINDVIVSEQSTAQIASTFSLIACPIYAFARISQQLNGTFDNEGNYFFNCATIDNLPPVRFDFSGHTVTLTYQDYITQVKGSKGQTQCMTVFTFVNTKYWILGIPFLTAVYTEFDITNDRLGMAPAIW